MSRFDTILLAEDDENDAFLFRRALSLASVANPVVHVLNGKDAMLYLTGVGVYSNRTEYPFPCLLVTDLKMPHLSGFDLLTQAKPILDSHQVSAVVLSASVAESDKKQALSLGARAFFVKPAGLPGLIALAKELKYSWLAPSNQLVSSQSKSSCQLPLGK